MEFVFRGKRAAVWRASRLRGSVFTMLPWVRYAKVDAER